MPVYTELQPLRRLDLNNGRILYFRAAHPPLSALNAIELWTALGLSQHTRHLDLDALAAVDSAFSEAVWNERVPLAIRHHNGAITIADLSGGNCTTISETVRPGLMRRILGRIGR